MVRIHAPYRTLTLETSLEEVIHLGDGYLLVRDEEGVQPQDLLVWLEQQTSVLLSMPVALVPPDATGEGAVYAVDPAGEPLTDTPLFRIERRRQPVSPDEVGH